MALLSLPHEILQHIAVCVETAYRPSLYAFSLTSKACHEAAVFVVFRQIIVTAHDREGLRRDVDRLIEALSRTDSLRHIRRITIKGDLRLSDNNTEGWGRQMPTDFDEVLLTEELVSYHDLDAVLPVYDEGFIEKSSEEDMAWAPVVNLLQVKLHLEDLVYDCQSQFPPSLLRALREKHPQCRLHHLTFRFRTLLQGVPNSYEMELATSPSLYRVMVTFAELDSNAEHDFNLEAMMELTTGLAPNLKKLLRSYPLSLRPPRRSWQGLPGFTGGKVGSLISLSLLGISRLESPTVLRNWARHINFACLQHLTLGGCHGLTASGLNAETMELVAQNYSFPRVKTLSVYLTRDDLYQASPHYSEHAVSFLQTFKSLEELSIYGPIDSQILDTVLSHHGQTLKRLILHPLESVMNNSIPRDRRNMPFEFTKIMFYRLKLNVRY
ncbi:kinase subdomain-containing protein [Rutstroemia sp. NJR-2017a BBW]|nr:kinase subdomain-containing protein [Rutstroemia sp. NJR-2017a BBW]